MGKWDYKYVYRPRVFYQWTTSRKPEEISVYIDLHRGKADDNIVGSPVELELSVGLLASLLISPGDGMDPWRGTDWRNGFHE